MCGTASSSTPPVELTWALLLGLAGGIVEESNAPHGGGPWQSTVGADLHGCRLGHLGLAKIGSRVAQVSLAFGMHVSTSSQNLTEERADEVGVELAASKEALLGSNDFVSIRLALGDHTHGLLGPAELALLKPTVYLIDTSRAAIVDQEALPRRPLRGPHRRRRHRRLRHRAPRRPPLAHGPRLLPTPHLGYVSRANNETYYGQAVENIRRSSRVPRTPPALTRPRHAPSRRTDHRMDRIRELRGAVEPGGPLTEIGRRP